MGLVQSWRTIRNPRMFVLSLVFLLFGLISFLIQTGLIFLQRFVFGFDWETSVVIAIVEWSVDVLHICVSSLACIGIYFRSRKILVLFFFIFSIYVLIRWIVYAIHGAFYPDGKFWWIGLAYGAIVSTVICAVFLLPFWVLVLIAGCTKRLKSHSSHSSRSSTRFNPITATHETQSISTSHSHSEHSKRSTEGLIHHKNV